MFKLNERECVALFARQPARALGMLSETARGIVECGGFTALFRIARMGGSKQVYLPLTTDLAKNRVVGAVGTEATAKLSKRFGSGHFAPPSFGHVLNVARRLLAEDMLLRGLSQGAIAARLGVSKRTIERYYAEMNAAARANRAAREVAARA